MVWHFKQGKTKEIESVLRLKEGYNVSVLGRDKGYTVNPLPEGVPGGKARGNF